MAGVLATAARSSIIRNLTELTRVFTRHDAQGAWCKCTTLAGTQPTGTRHTEHKTKYKKRINYDAWLKHVSVNVEYCNHTFFNCCKTKQLLLREERNNLLPTIAVHAFKEIANQSR